MLSTTVLNVENCLRQDRETNLAFTVDAVTSCVTASLSDVQLNPVVQPVFSRP
jgi:hypothetical protein